MLFMPVAPDMTSRVTMPGVRADRGRANMKRWLWNGRRWGGLTVLPAALWCALCGAQQEPVVPAAAATPPAAPAAAVTDPEPVAQPQAGVVTSNILVVRARPALHYERIGQFGRGDKVTIVGGNADWYEVLVPPDTRAWVAAQYLNAEGTVTADKVRLHSGPGLVFTTFSMANQGTKLEILGPPVDGWQQVRAPADASAWISRAYVRTVDPEPPAEVAPPPAAAETATAAPAAPAEPAPAPAEALAEPAPAAPPADTPAAPAEATVEPPAPAVTAPAEPAPPAVPAETPAPAPAEPSVGPQPAPAAADAAPAEAPAATPAEPTVAPQPAPAPPAGAAPAEPGPTTPAETTPTPPATAAAPAGEAVMVPTVPAPDAPVVMKEGVLLSLKSQASELATHVLCMRVGTTAYPICYLKSARLDLTEWENREVRLYGRELRLPGWSLPVLHVHSIQVNLEK